jgi:chromosomal replication initiator protein DnaA
MKAVWQAAKEILKNQLPEATFDLWIEPLLAETGPEGELALSCPNPFALRWIQAHYLQLILETLGNLWERSRPVHLKLLIAPLRPPAVIPASQPSLPLVPQKAGRWFNRAFTFDQFVVGSSNRLAYQASRALARNDTFYNRILFLTSGPGLGKSHLSQAVGNFVSQAAAGRQVRYLTAENFANEMVDALKNGQMSTFKERFRRDCDVLLLEEVQFLSGKEKIQAEVCYTLDTLISQNKRLVFTSCYLPGEISHLSQELRSRLTGGLITPIAPPDFATRVNILGNKAKNRGVQVSVKILEYLAEYVDGDVRRGSAARFEGSGNPAQNPGYPKDRGGLLWSEPAGIAGTLASKAAGAGPADGPLFLPDLHGKDHDGVGAPVPEVPCLGGPCLANPGTGPQDSTASGQGDLPAGGENGPGQGQAGVEASIHSSHRCLITRPSTIKTMSSAMLVAKSAMRSRFRTMIMK